jgi:hypothetical protein
MACQEVGRTTFLRLLYDVIYTSTKAILTELYVILNEFDVLFRI